MTDTQKKNLRKWIKALKSGEYKKTTERLKRADRFCGMGVGCDLFIREHKTFRWKGSEIQKDNGGGDYTYYISGEAPREVLKWLGISDSFQSKVIAWNDEEKLSLKEIGTEIEAKYFPKK